MPLSLLHARPGDLDKTFGSGLGYVVSDDPNGVVGNDDIWYSVAIQSDGKIVVAGSTNSGDKAIVARYTSAGVLDTTFGDANGAVRNGYVIADNIAGGTDGSDTWQSVAIQSDGKIVVAGYTNNQNKAIVARYTSAGLLDETFGELNGFVRKGYVTADNIAGGTDGSDTWNSVVIQSDGKIVVAGFTNDADKAIVARYTSAGVLDTTTFGNGLGYVLSDIDGGGGRDIWVSVAVQSDGKIVVAGITNNLDKAIVARYTSAGVLDTTTFGGSNGYVISDNPNGVAGNDVWRSMAIQKDGGVEKIVVAGYTNGGEKAIVARYTSAGVLDTTFGNGKGYVISDNPAGTGDDEWYSIVVQSDGKIVVAGYTNGNEKAIVARYTSVGVLDTTFANGNGYVISDNLAGTGNDIWNAVAMSKNASTEKIVVAGYTNGQKKAVVAQYLDLFFDEAGAAETYSNEDNALIGSKA